MCYFFACRTGQSVCGTWTVAVCAVWPGATVTPMLWAPSPAQGIVAGVSEP